MRRILHLLRLTVLVNRASKAKLTLLTLLVSLGFLVFLSTSELSRASSDNLTDAIAKELGTAGTYRAEVPSNVMNDPRLLARTVSGALGPLAQSVVMADALPPVHPECPPYDTIGALNTFVLRDHSASASPFSSSGDLVTQADLCLAGLTIPRDALRATSKVEERTLGTGLVVRPEYEPLIRLTSLRPVRFFFIITTGRQDDLSGEISLRVRQALHEQAARLSMTDAEAVTVIRTDSGAGVRNATNGIQLVYLLIGWGVLIIAGTGLLVAELVVLKDRTWFFGLARAVGARKVDIAGLVFLDIVLVLLCGLSATVVLGVAFQPLISSFGKQAFNADLVLLRADSLPALAAGSLLLLAVGGLYPSLRAVRLDPVDVLERR